MKWFAPLNPYGKILYFEILRRRIGIVSSSSLTDEPTLKYMAKASAVRNRRSIEYSVDDNGRYPRPLLLPVLHNQGKTSIRVKLKDYQTLSHDYVLPSSALVNPSPPSSSAQPGLQFTSSEGSQVDLTSRNWFRRSHTPTGNSSSDDLNFIGAPPDLNLANVTRPSILSSFILLASRLSLNKQHSLSTYDQNSSTANYNEHNLDEIDIPRQQNRGESEGDVGMGYPSDRRGVAVKAMRKSSDGVLANIEYIPQPRNRKKIKSAQGPLADVQWRQVGGTRKKRLKREAEDAELIARVEFRPDSSEYEYVDDTLEPFTRYEYAIRAVNSQGSTQSRWRTVFTKQVPYILLIINILFVIIDIYCIYCIY